MDKATDLSDNSLVSVNGACRSNPTWTIIKKKTDRQTRNMDNYREKDRQTHTQTERDRQHRDKQTEKP